MNRESALADILRQINSHFQDIDKRSCEVNDGVQRIVRSESSVGGGGLLSSQTSTNISLLNQSLKLSERSPLLDAALSLMGYRMHHVYNSTTDILVKTIVSLLLSTINCQLMSKCPNNAFKVIENDESTSHDIHDMAFQKQEKAVVCGTSGQWLLSDQEFLHIGSFISVKDLSKILEACTSMFKNLEAHGKLSMMLMDALLRVTISMTPFKVQFPLSSITYKKSMKGKSSSTQLLNHFVTKGEVLNQHFNSSFRGADRILEVCIELLAAVLDVHSNPSSWGISVDDGLKLPPSYAFFSQRQQPLLMNLMKPLSCSNFVEIVDTLEDMQSLETFRPNIYPRPDASQNKHGSVIGSSSSYQKSSEMSLLINHNSSWSLLLDFPLWFHFASMLLFQPEHIDSLDSGIGAVCYDCEQSHSNNSIENVDKVGSRKSNSSYMAAKYLGWVLSPIDARHRDLVVKSLIEASKGWNLRRPKLLMFSQRKKIGEINSDYNNLHFANRNQREKSLVNLESENYMRVEKAKLETVENDTQTMDIFHCLKDSAQAVMLWLGDFNALCSECLLPAFLNLGNTKSCSYRVAGSDEGYDESEDGTSGKDNGWCQNAPSDAWLKKYAFLRRISMGLFLSNVHILDEQACHIILHFAAADNDLAQIPDSDACTYYEKTPRATAHHVVTSSNVRNIGTDVGTKKSTHKTGSSRNSMLWYFQSQGRTNWTRVASVILSFLDIIETSYSVFENVNGCPSFWSDVRQKGLKFLVTCIQQLLECGDFSDPTLLTDLRSRFVSWTQQGEAIFLEKTLYDDILHILDSQISS